MSDKHPLVALLSTAAAFGAVVFAAVQYVQVRPLEQKQVELQQQLEQTSRQVRLSSEYQELEAQQQSSAAELKLLRPMADALNVCREQSAGLSENARITAGNADAYKNAYNKLLELQKEQAAEITQLQERAALLDRIESIKSEQKAAERVLAEEASSYPRREMQIQLAREKVQRLQEQINGLLRGVSCKV